jgi:hypothetical protein
LNPTPNYFALKWREKERKKNYSNKKELERSENNFASIKFGHSRKRPSLFGHLSVGLVTYLAVFCRGEANTGGAT